MRTLTQREAATVRAALSMWARTTEPSPALVYTASEGNVFQPLDPEEVEELIGVLQQTRVGVTPVHEDIIEFVRKLAKLEWFDTAEKVYLGLSDEAKALTERLDE